MCKATRALRVLGLQEKRGRNKDACDWFIYIYLDSCDRKTTKGNYCFEAVTVVPMICLSDFDLLSVLTVWQSSSNFGRADVTVQHSLTVTHCIVSVI